MNTGVRKCGCEIKGADVQIVTDGTGVCWFRCSGCGLSSDPKSMVSEALKDWNSLIKEGGDKPSPDSVMDVEDDETSTPIQNWLEWWRNWILLFGGGLLLGVLFLSACYIWLRQVFL